MFKHVTGAAMIGKTVRNVSTVNGAIIIVFDDETYLRIIDGECAELQIENAARCSNHKRLVELGLFTAEELANAKARCDAIDKAHIEQYERAQYEKLRSKFEQQAIKVDVNAMLKQLAGAFEAMKLPVSQGPS